MFPAHTPSFAIFSQCWNSHNPTKLANLNELTQGRGVLKGLAGVVGRIHAGEENGTSCLVLLHETNARSAL